MSNVPFVTWPVWRSRLAAAGLALLASAVWWPRPAQAAPPAYDHVVVVIEENEGITQIIGNTAQAPYIHSLARGGVSLTRMRGVTHPSHPNYLELFSGDNQGITSDGIPSSLPFTTPNLGAALRAAGLTFTGYAESVPAAGDTTSDNLSTGYVRRHCPWIWWTTAATPTLVNRLPRSVHQPFSAFPTDFTLLPTVSFVIPNNFNNMHDLGVQSGDVWLSQNLSAYAEWAKTHNSLLIVTWDEDNFGATNLIPTIFYGANLRRGVNAGSWTLHNLLRTLEEMYGLPHSGRAASAPPITGVFSGELPVGSLIVRPGSGVTLRDTKLSQAAADTTYPALTQIAVSDAAGSATQGLLRFESLFGTGSGQLDPAANVVSAKLVLTTCSNVSGASSGSPMRLHRMLVPWTDASTWRSMTSGISADGVEALAVPDFTAVPNYPSSASSGVGTAVTFDVTPSVQAWKSGATNFGWATLTASADAWIYAAAGEVSNNNPGLEISFHASAVAFAATAVSVPEDAGVAELTVTRTGETSGNLSVAYAPGGGTASSGTDYTGASGVLTWEAGDAAPKTIRVAILPDSEVEGHESFSLVLTVVAGLGIEDTDRTVTVTILEKPFNVWRRAAFGADANSPSAAESADPDGDGLSNLVEYACATDPLLASAAGRPVLGGSDAITLTFRRNVSATDVTHQVQASSDLAAWENGSRYAPSGDISSNGVTSEVSRAITDGVETIVVRDNTPRSASAARYLRLRVSRAE